MAIKGKKKSQQRGSQGVRRPAAAPRPAVSTARRGKTPFYKTRDGMLILGIFVLVFLGVIAWLIGSARERQNELEASRTAIRQYTDQAEAALTQADTTIREMVSLAGPIDDAIETLEEDPAKWVTELQQVQGSLAQLLPASELIEVNQLFNEALALYGAAADTFALVPEARGDLQEQIFTRAAVQRDTASAIFETAIGVLNRIRTDKDLPAAGILPPAAPPSDMELPGDGSVEVPIGGTEEDTAEDSVEDEGDPAGAGGDENTGEGE